MKKFTIGFLVSMFLCSMLALFVNTAKAQVTMRFGSTFTGSPTSFTFTSTDVAHRDAAGTGTFSTSGSNLCSGALRRTQTTTLILRLVSTSASRIVVHGTSSGTTIRNLNLLESASTQNGTYTTITGFTAPSTITTSSTTCGTIDIQGLNISLGAFVRFTFSGNVNVSGFDVYPACTTPTINTQPSTATQDVCQGSSTTALSISATNATAYQWYSNTTASNSGGTLISGATSDTYTPQNTTVGTLYYYCIALNTPCSATSSVSGAVNILALPSISSQNTPGTSYGENFPSPAALTVTATGAGASYQWYSSTDAATNTSGDDNMVGTNSNSFTPPTTPQGTLYYYCVVSGTCTPVATSAISGAIIIVPSCTQPTFSVQPTDLQTECTGGILTLGIVVADQSPTYQWYSNTTKSNTGGTSVGAANGGSTDTYTPPSTTPGTYYYYVVATNGACPTASDPVEITVDGVTITGQNTPAANYSVGASAAALTIAATGSGLSYQWYSSTDAATNTSVDDIAVGTNATSYSPSTASLGTLYYYCVVSGACPPSATSAVSGAITIVQYTVGDYGSFTSGNWGTLATWRQWNGTGWNTAVPTAAPTTSSNVFVLASHTVTVEASAKTCNNLTVDGTLRSSSLVNSPFYVRVYGTTITVNTGGFIGNSTTPTGDNSDGISLDIYNNGGTQTITGTGGGIYFSRMKTNFSNTTLVVDHDMTLNYHGTTNQGGHTASFYPNAASVDNTVLTINAGKTLTLAPWSVIATTSSSNAIPATSMTVNVNGTLTLQDSPAPNLQVVGAANSFIYGGTAAGDMFTLNIGSTGIVNTPQIYPNGTVSGGGVGTGADATITITGSGQLNISKTADFRKATQIVTGTGEFNLLSGATLRIGSADGIAASAALGHIQTTTRSYNTGASYSYEGAVAQSAGDGLPSSVNNLTINNTSGVTLAGGVSVNGVLALSNGKLNTGVNSVTVTATGSSITGGSSSNYVNGNLSRAVDAGISTVAFPIGDAGAYAPLSINFGAGNSAGNLTASTTKPGVPPAAGNAPVGSGIDQTKYIDRAWALSSTIGTPDYDATFTYVDPADVVGANTSALIIAKNNAGTWSNPGVASSIPPAVSSVAGQTAFSTFYLGEAAPVGCTNNTFSGTGNWTDNARWSCGAPPASGDNVTIASGANATLDVDYDAAGSLTMTATSTLTINPARTFTISGTADFAGQSVTLKSDNSGTASIGQVTGTLSGATNVTVERYVPNNGFRSWRLLSVPVTSLQTIRQAWQEGDDNPNPKDNNVANFGTQITGVFSSQAAAAAAGFDSTSVQAAMLRWNGTGWSNITSTNQPINNFNSYFLYIRGNRAQTVTGLIQNSSATTLRTKGTVFIGDQTTNVGASAFALVPNVYPSAINFTGLTRTGGVNNLFYIWDAKKLSGSSLGTYQTFSATNSFNCLIGGGSYTLGQPNTVIESGQSFFVTSGAAGTVVLKESAKTNGTNGSLGFRPAGVKRKIDTRLYNSSNEMLDATAVVFDAGYRKSVADEDAPKLGNPGANFAIETDGKLLAIAGTPPVDENDAIQFRMWNIGQGDYTLEFATSNINLTEGMEAKLEDSYLKTSTTISLSDVTKVKFTVNANAGSAAANRFKIVFAKAKLSIAETAQGYAVAPNPVENGVMKIVFRNQPAGKYTIRVLAASGQLIQRKVITHSGGNITQNNVLPAAMGEGVYTVEIFNPAGKKATQIVLIK